MPVFASFWSSLGRLGAQLGPLGRHLGVLLVSLAPSGRSLGLTLGQLEASWRHWELSLSPLGATLTIQRSIWGARGPFLVPLGANLH